MVKYLIWSHHLGLPRKVVVYSCWSRINIITSYFPFINGLEWAPHFINIPHRMNSYVISREDLFFLWQTLFSYPGVLDVHLLGINVGFYARSNYIWFCVSILSSCMTSFTTLAWKLTHYSYSGHSNFTEHSLTLTSAEDT